MNQLDALKKMCDHYPGGRAAVAMRLGKSDDVLRKELSGDPRFKMGVVDACGISTMCVELQAPFCNEYAKAVAASCGGFVALEVRGMAAKQDLRAGMARMLKECSDAVVVLTSALSDEALSDNETKSVTREITELLSEAQNVLRDAVALNAAGRKARRAA